MQQWLSLTFQDGASPAQEQMVLFHDHAMVILVMITALVGYFLVAAMVNTFTFHTLMHNQLIELLWTCWPCVVLLFIALPSLRLLYLLDEVGSPSFTVKAVGHQWYWSYEYTDMHRAEFDSYVIPSSQTKNGGYRLLEVDNRVVVPYNLCLRVLVSSEDVLHSWTVPSLGVKADAMPGRLNQVSFSCLRPGVYFGQCSEICGANHSFMPIAVEAVNSSAFVKWLQSFGS